MRPFTQDYKCGILVSFDYVCTYVDYGFSDMGNLYDVPSIGPFKKK